MDREPTDAQWRDWLSEHSAKFWLFARQKARSDADAEDLMQEAIIEAAKRNTGKGLPAPPLVFATIHRRAIDQARQASRRAARELAVAESVASFWFDTTAEDRDRARLIQDALSKLPEIYREVVTLKVWGELTFAEIAEALKIPPNTAASRYRYGLDALRNLTKEVLT
ncbi:MAG TPA: RNA polymerase sigma factor [Patescibacteria group bacterium]|nr:RNA polymerase sigma factor [Patescibacteria group bacterium]